MRYLDEAANFDEQRDLRRLGASLVLGRLDLKNAIDVAVAVVVGGRESASAVSLAAMSSDPKQLSSFEVEPLVSDMLTELGVPIPAKTAAGWTIAGFIAEAMIAGAIDPPTGAHRLWSLWEVCGAPDDELTGMLELHDMWESSVGQRRIDLEAEMVAFAPSVVAAANRHTDN